MVEEQLTLTLGKLCYQLDMSLICRAKYQRKKEVSGTTAPEVYTGIHHGCVIQNRIAYAQGEDMYLAET